MSEQNRPTFEADPLAVVDHDFIAQAMLIRLHRGPGPLANLDAKLFEEMSRPGNIDDFTAMLSTLMSHGYYEDGELAVMASKTSYVFGAALALEVLDAIAFDQKLSLAEYRTGMVGPADTVTSPLKIDASDNDPVRLMFYVGQAILRQGEDEFERAELPYQALCGSIIAGDSDVLMLPQPFLSGFGMVYAKGKQAQVNLIEDSYDLEARKLAGSASQLDHELAEFLGSSS